MNKHAQKGMTTIGWIIIIAIFGMIVLTGFKIFPMYMEYFSVRSVMESVATDEELDVRSKSALWTAINKRLLINRIKILKRENFKFDRAKDKTTISVDYEVREPYIAELFLGAHFTYSVETTR